MMKLVVMKCLCLLLLAGGLLFVCVAMNVQPARELLEQAQNGWTAWTAKTFQLQIPGILAIAALMGAGLYGLAPHWPRRKNRFVHIETDGGKAFLRLSDIRTELTRQFKSLEGVHSVRITVDLEDDKPLVNVKAEVVLKDCFGKGVYPQVQSLEASAARLARNVVGQKNLSKTEIIVKRVHWDFEAAVNTVLAQVQPLQTATKALRAMGALPLEDASRSEVSKNETLIPVNTTYASTGKVPCLVEQGGGFLLNMDSPCIAQGGDTSFHALHYTDTYAMRILPEWLQQGNCPTHGGFMRVLFASCGHAMKTLTRRKRLALAVVIAFLPVLLPLALAFFSSSQFAESGNVVFVRLVEDLHINVFCPLLALFFAGMLIAEDIETRTMPYILTRPAPRSAWVLGRFLAYMMVAVTVLLSSAWLTFAASTAHAELSLTNRTDLYLLLHYSGVMVLGLLAYGGFAVFLGAFTKRPIVYGVILFYGWQHVATLVPGLVDFFTIKKYTDAILPIMATQRNVTEIQTALGTFQREVFLVSAGKAILTLVVIMMVSLMITILAVSKREYAADRAAGG